MFSENQTGRSRWLVSAIACATVALFAILWSASLAMPAHAAQDASQGDNLAAAHPVEQASAKAAASEEKAARRVLDDGLYNIVSPTSSEQALSVKGGSNKAGVNALLVDRDKKDWAQKWTVTWDSRTGYYKIKSLNSRKCLGIKGTAKAGSVVRQMTPSRSETQLWEAVKTSNGVMFKMAGSKLALTVIPKEKGSPVLKLAKAKTANNAQRFVLHSVDALEVDQTYYLSSVSTGRRLHVSGNSRSSKAKLDLTAAANDKSQKFRVLKSGSSYCLQNVRSCYYVGVNKKGSGAIYQYSKKHGDRTRFDIDLDLEAAAFTLKSRVSGKAISTASGKARLEKQSGADAQLFTLSKTYAFKLYLNPGHGWNSNGNGVWDPGAVGSGHQEAEFSHDLCQRVERLLAGTDIKVVNGEKYHLAFWKRMPKAVKLGCDAIVSVHFDAGGSSGTLKMVGVQGRARGSDALANFVHKGVTSRLGLPNRGRSTRSDITCVNGPIPSMLTEVCYMDNSGDVHTYLKKRKAVAKGLASGIKKASRSRKVVR